jgi:hypothetical protein
MNISAFIQTPPLHQVDQAEFVVRNCAETGRAG